MSTNQQAHYAVASFALSKKDHDELKLLAQLENTSVSALVREFVIPGIIARRRALAPAVQELLMAAFDERWLAPAGAKADEALADKDAP